MLVPIPNFGHVPFHVSTIRNVFCQSEDSKKFSVLRIQFQVPGSIGFGYKADANPFPEVTGPDGMFIKELIFRSSNRTSYHLSTSQSISQSYQSLSMSISSIDLCTSDVIMFFHYINISHRISCHDRETQFYIMSAQLQQTFKSLKDLQKRIKQREETGVS